MNKLFFLAMVIPPMLCCGMTYEESEAGMVRALEEFEASERAYNNPYNEGDLRESSSSKEGESSWTQLTYLEFGSNQLLYVIPCPCLGASHVFKQGKRGIEIEAGIIYPYSGLVGYVTANYLMFLEQERYAFGIGVQGRFGKVDRYLSWGHAKWTGDLSPDIEFIKFFEDGNTIKIQAYIPFNLRVVYGWGF